MAKISSRVARYPTTPGKGAKHGATSLNVGADGRKESSHASTNNIDDCSELVDRMELSP